MGAKTDSPIISLIMPVFNSKSDYERGNGKFLLPEAIDSILCQSFKQFELVILDNLSDDGTFEYCNTLLKRDERIRLIRDNLKRSPEESIFKLIQLAAGEFTVIVNDDDRWDENFLSTLLELHNSGNYDLVYSNGQYLNLDNTLLGKITKDKSFVYSNETLQLNNFSRYIHNRNPFPISFGLFRTHILRKYYPEFKFHTYRANMDNLFICNLLLNSMRIKFIDYDLFFYRHKSRSYEHASEFKYSSEVPPEREFAELLEHQAEFYKVIATKINHSSLDNSDKSIAQTVNSNAFIEYVLKMSKWQLEKPGLSKVEFSFVVKIVSALEIILSIILINSGTQNSWEEDSKNQSKEVKVDTYSDWITLKILDFLKLDQKDSPGDFFKEFRSLLSSIALDLEVSEAEFGSSLNRIYNFKQRKRWRITLRKLLFNSFLYYRFIKSR